MAARAFDLGRDHMVEKVIQNDKNIDQLEVEVEEACLKALALISLLQLIYASL